MDGDECHRCRVAFSLTQRKHHCRQCGNVFCQACSSRTVSLPELGIPEPSRVCEPCHVQRIEARTQLQKSAPLPVVPHEEEEESDPELARAIRLSLQEAQPKRFQAPQPVPVPAASSREHEEAVEEERMFRAAIEASLREAHPSQQHTAPPTVVSGLTELDKENVKLFSQLVDRLSLSGGGSVIEPEVEALSMAMHTLRDTLKTVIYELKKGSPEMAGLLASLEISLAKYQLLRSLPRTHQHTAYMPSIPPPSSTPTKTYPVAVMPSYPPPSMVPPPAQHEPKGPSADAYPIPEGQLLDDEPLIKL